VRVPFHNATQKEARLNIIKKWDQQSVIREADLCQVFHKFKNSSSSSSSSSSSTTNNALGRACEDDANGGDWEAVATGEAFDDVSEGGSDYEDGLVEPQDEANRAKMNEARQIYLLRYGAIDIFDA
jgi:hypothetical protein